MLKGSFDKRKATQIILICATGLYLLAFFYMLITSGQAWMHLIWHTDTSGILPDLSQTIAEAKWLSPYSMDTYAIYPPLTYLLFSVLANCIPGFPSMTASITPIGSTVMIYFIIFCVVFTFVMVERYAECSSPIKLWISCAYILSAPFIFALERGQPILLTVLLCGVFLQHYDSGNRIKRELALVALALAFNMKMTPALLGLLLLQKKQYREAFRCVAYGLGLFFFPILLLENNVGETVRRMTEGIRLFSVIGDEPGYGFRISIASWVSLIGAIAGFPRIMTVCCTWILSAIVPIMMLMVFLCTDQYWKRALALILIIACVSAFSWIYNICYLLPVALLFIRSLHEKDRLTKSDLLFIILFLLAFIPLPYCDVFTSMPGTHKTSLNTLISNLSLFLMIACLSIESVIIMNQKAKKVRTTDNSKQGR